MAPKTKERNGGNKVTAPMTLDEEEPDMEDMLAPARKKPKPVINKSGSNSFQRHATAAHDLRPTERSNVRAELLRWYDAHRRKLPWRGDAPPFLSTATHTKQRAAVAMTTASGTLDAFFKREAPQDEPIRSEEQQCDELQVKKESEATSEVQEVQQRRKVSPYETWVSEIMLQQTRVDTVVDYFLRWTDKFPTVAALASGSEEVQRTVVQLLLLRMRRTDHVLGSACRMSTRSGRDSGTTDGRGCYTPEPSTSSRTMAASFRRRSTSC